MGEVTLNPARVVDTPPAGLNYVTSSIGSAVVNMVTWSSIVPMTHSQTKKIWMVAHINGAAYGALNNTVQITGSPPIGTNVTNQSYRIVTTESASISVSKIANPTADTVGDAIKFNIKIKNTGQSTLPWSAPTIPCRLNSAMFSAIPATTRWCRSRANSWSGPI